MSSKIQAPPANRSTPRSRSQTVTSPSKPTVARKAKASVTPPNCASTPEAEVTTRRRTPSGLPVTTAQASSAPKTAPVTAVIADSWMLRTNASRYGPCAAARTLASVGVPASSTNAPATTTSVG